MKPKRLHFRRYSNRRAHLLKEKGDPGARKLYF